MLDPAMIKSTISPASQTALLGLAGILALCAGMIPAPGGRVLAAAAGAGAALAVAVAGSPAARRVIALLILAVTLLLAVSSWGPYRALLERYRTHAGQ